MGNYFLKPIFITDYKQEMFCFFNSLGSPFLGIISILRGSSVTNYKEIVETIYQISTWDVLSIKALLFYSEKSDLPRKQ